MIDRYGFRKLEAFFAFLISVMAVAFGYEVNLFFLILKKRYIFLKTLYFFMKKIKFLVFCRKTRRIGYCERNDHSVVSKLR